MGLSFFMCRRVAGFGNENKILVLEDFGSASKFWARFYGFWGGAR